MQSFSVPELVCESIRCVIIFSIWILTSNMAAASSVPVETLVFMHSKASDSSKDGENPRITEICMRAVSRKHFLSRALNKHENTIKLVAMPKDEKEQTVSKVAAEKEKQESKQESLDAADAELLKSFLLRLKKPVCIVAYSGKTYDFRFLKLLLNKVQGGPISDLLYADTFEGFKVILKEKLETQMEILSLAGSSLHVIYERMFGKPKFNIHFTESNVEMMYEITLKNAKVFMGWIDQNAHK